MNAKYGPPNWLECGECVRASWMEDRWDELNKWLDEQLKIATGSWLFEIQAIRAKVKSIEKRERA